jgi:uncharacterized protein YndB with AHSA1/START domain
MTLSPLVLKKIFHTSQERVFDAWTKPELMQQWFSPEGSWQRKTSNTLKVDGKYQHDMIDPEGNVYPHTGEYIELVRPSKIVFTWNSPKVTNTQVTIELKKIDANTTELTLTHDFFTDEEIKNRHQNGWKGCFEHLEKLLTSPSHKKNFHCEITLNSDTKNVYQAITEQKGISCWWTETCTAESKEGSKARFDFGNTYNIMEIERLISNEAVNWRCIEQNHASSELTKHDEWVGKRILFHLKANQNGGTDLSFTHEGLTEDLQCYDMCFKGWTHFITNSLKNYVEKGKGEPFSKSTSSCS